MDDWKELMEGRTFITDLGVPRQAVGRYAVWSPLRGAEGHTVVEVGSDLHTLMERYGIPAERVCTLTTD